MADAPAQPLQSLQTTDSRQQDIHQNQIEILTFSQLQAFAAVMPEGYIEPTAHQVRLQMAGKQWIVFDGKNASRGARGGQHGQEPEGIMRTILPIKRQSLT